MDIGTFLNCDVSFTVMVMVVLFCAIVASWASVINFVYNFIANPLTAVACALVLVYKYKLNDARQKGIILEDQLASVKMHRDELKRILDEVKEEKKRARASTSPRHRNTRT